MLRPASKIALGLAAAFLGLVLVQSAASAQDLFAGCRVIADPQKIGCQIRFSDPLLRPRVQSVTVKWPPSDSNEAAEFQERNPNNDVTAWLFLVDRTKSMLREEAKPGVTLKAITDDIRAVSAGPNTNHMFGLATFADDYKVLARIGSSKSAIDEELKKLKIDGNDTGMYRRVRDALDTLDAFPGASRKALVLMSDGDAEDPESEYFKTDVIEFATNRGIAIYGIGYPSRTLLHFQTLERLSKETRGPSVQVDKTTRRIPANFADTFTAHMDNGGYATFPNRARSADNAPPKLTVTANLVGGRSLTRDVIFKNYTPDTGLLWWWKTLETWKQYTYAGLAAGLPVLLGLGVWAMRRGRGEGRHSGPITMDSEPLRRPLPNTIDAVSGGTMVGGTDYHSPRLSLDTTAQMSNAGNAGSMKKTVILDNNGGGQIYAWLNRTDSSDRIAIRKTVINIGRHEDNDVRFDEESVHRRHANINMTPQREFIITDLSTKDGNHVFVNDQKIERHMLRDGDVIKLGKVRLRFQVSTV